MDWRSESCPSLLDWRRQGRCQGVRRGGRLQRSQVHLNATTPQGDVKAVERSPPAGVREAAAGQIVGIAVAGVLEPARAAHELEFASPLERASRLEAAVVKGDDRALCQADGLSGLSEDLARDRLCLTVEAIAGDDALDEAVAVGRLCVDWVAGEYHRHRDPGRHVAGQGLRSAGRRDVAEADFGEAESD